MKINRKKLPSTKCHILVVFTLDICDSVLELLNRITDSKIAEYDLQDIVLPRHVNTQAARRYSYSQQAVKQPIFTSAKDYFRVQFFSFVDCAIQHISDRLDQPGMKIYCQLESILLSACRGEEFSDLLTDACNIYDDFDKSRL
jgi:hypothetical protein